MKYFSDTEQGEKERVSEEITKNIHDGIVGIYKKYVNKKSFLKKKEQQWLKENKEAIDKHNERVEKHGCFSDVYRRF